MTGGPEQAASAGAGLRARVRRRVAAAERFARRVAADPARWQEEIVLARLEGGTPFEPGVADLGGQRIEYSHPQSLAAQYRSIFQEECYRFDTARPDPSIVDCGANIGVACLYWLRHFPSPRITALEPDPALFRLLSRNVEGFAARPRLLEAAVWTADGRASFRRQGAGGGRLGTGGAEVETRRLASVLREADPASERIDLLKIDVEGAEPDLLADCAPLLDRVERVFVEYHSAVGQPQRLPEVVEILSGAGFRLAIGSELVPRAPFVAKPPRGDFDMQLNIWATRPGS